MIEQDTDEEHRSQGRDPADKDHEMTRIVTKGGKIHIELPGGGKGSLRRSRTLVVESADDVVDGFVSFLREKAVVGLAVGFVIGTQAQGLIKELVASFIDPLFTLLFGRALTHQTFTLQFHGRTAEFSWGVFAYALLNFLFVLFAIYAIIKFFKLDKLDKKAEEDAADEARADRDKDQAAANQAQQKEDEE